ncbi:TPA: ribonuclease Y [candidate division CPR2 bacterium]|uniref:Ribonuclease Y n=1 Tax=candidate division CPR2 bacterium GW2011_GWC1_41_48 TaxID=1618344 RepID=A0A0G0Z833_UNCC2|nr:MAG: Ribonuclease Y [candidate division CPR2 bacterium GW2011_GWC2_39_35]KKS09178.1 MAG: Ribonuclease Y [candidate division CPR2 bacterium GW2011_GWC1_41_48]OGB70953.1 MAG: ribonuclease Y [candidate division CPR2 bacterium GWD2_39_7]HBG81749.1 ribonuclease Y [candidate division CPR2 bacterium]HCM00079.1 ribonuclease Y [candidate division CPR2 bacterium]
MNPVTLIVLLAGGALAGSVSGYYYRKVKVTREAKGAEAEATKLIEDAKRKAKDTVLEAKDEALKISEAAKKEEKERRDQILKLEERLASKEENLENKYDELDKKKEELTKSRAEIEDIKNQLRAIRTKQEETLVGLAKLTKEEAKEKLFKLVEKDYKEDMVNWIRKVQEEVKEDADSKAREILAYAIQHIAQDFTAETTISTVALPSDEMKGRIIGREGRNIHAIERATGCDIIVDDTPETIVISGFDPVRRAVAKLSLEKLLQDGRIHPSRIEEMVGKCEKEIDKSIKEAGEQAVYEAGVNGLSPEIVKILGRLKYRTSYAQNVLRHSIETSKIAAAIAAEVKADVKVAKVAGILHDIGKAVDQEITGTHAIISRDIAKKFSLPEPVLHAIEAHHEEVEFKTIEAVIVKVADAISGARPGARRDSLDNYVKRLGELEAIANAFEGVEKSFAIQAGREVRVIVNPENMDDLEATKLARDIADKIENDLKYPGQIKVNVIRETRAIEYAK